MKKLLRQYASYNCWANERLCSLAAGLSEEQYESNVVSSFPTLKKTLLHIWDAQDIWMERLDGVSPVTWPSASFKGNKEDLLGGLIASSRRLESVMHSCDRQGLKAVKTYHSLLSGEYRNPVYHVFLHVINHSTYHRGQAVTIMRQLGCTRFPSMDFIFYQRERRKVKESATDQQPKSTQP